MKITFMTIFNDPGTNSYQPFVTIREPIQTFRNQLGCAGI